MALQRGHIQRKYCIIYENLSGTNRHHRQADEKAIGTVKAAQPVTFLAAVEDATRPSTQIQSHSITHTAFNMNSTLRATHQPSNATKSTQTHSLAQSTVGLSAAHPSATATGTHRPLLWVDHFNAVEVMEPCRMNRNSATIRRQRSTQSSIAGQPQKRDHGPRSAD